jgi:hypothetical protein
MKGTTVTEHQMRRAQVIQIALLLVAIFAAGVATGRFTAPNGPTYVRNAAGRYVTSDAKLEQLTLRLKLDQQQREQFRALLEETAKELAKYPALSQDRLDVFRKSVPKQRALLRTNQYERFDAMVADSERKFEQARRRHRAR